MRRASSRSRADSRSRAVRNDRSGIRPMNVCADQHDTLAILFLQAPGELGRCGRLAGPLQACEKYHDWRLRSQIERHGVAAEHVDQLGMDDLDEGLAGRKALADLLANGALPDMLDEGLDHRQRDVCLQEREAHLPHRILDIGVGNAALAAQILGRAAQPF